MRSEKAFTLVELLGILVILGLIAILSFPSIITLIKRSDNMEYERFLKDLELITETYINENADELDLNEPEDSTFIKLDDMVNAGYLNRKMINPKTGEEIGLETTMFVTVLNDYTREYKYTGVVNDLSNYHSSNLKVMLDGYNRLVNKSGQIIWKDVMGNRDGIMTTTGGVQDWNTNKIRLNETGNYLTVPGSSLLFPNTSEVTIEMVYEIPQEGANVSYKSKGLGLSYFDVFTDGVIQSMVKNSTDAANEWPRATKLSMRDINTVHTITIVMKKNGSLFDFKYYGDGEALAVTNMTGLKYPISDFIIGKDYTSDPANVYIYALRIYDIALDYDQISNNYQIDMNRYIWR